VVMCRQQMIAARASGRFILAAARGSCYISTAEIAHAAPSSSPCLCPRIRASARRHAPGHRSGGP
jgi:hypothetical protein